MLTQQTPSPAQSKPVRAAVIGVGNIGSAHAACIYSGQVEGMVLSALCDSSPAVKEMALEQYPDVPFYTDVEQLLASDVDVVVVAVPHPMHADVSIRAFEKGKHVLVEKPLDITLTKGKALAEAAERSGKCFGIMFNQRTGNLFQKAKEIVESGQLGQLKRSVWVITNWYRSQSYYDSGSWRATWAGEGGGVLMNQCPHQLDLWQWICGMPEQVTAFCDEAKFHRIEVEDNATVLVKFPGGGDGAFITSTGEFPGTNRLEIVGDRGKMVLEEGKVKLWRLQESTEAVSASSRDNMPTIVYTFEEFTPDCPDKAHCGIIENFVSAVLYQTPLLADGREGIHQLMLTNAAYLSAWQDKTVTLPIDGAEFDRYHTEKRNGEGEKSQGAASSGGGDGLPRWQVNW